MFGARGRAARPVRRGGVCQAPRVGGAAAKPTPRRAVRARCGEAGRVMSRWRRVGRQQWPRPRPREAHAAAHLRIVPVDAPSTLDQPPELRLLAVVCGLIHGLVHRVAHCARRALQAFARSDSCAFGGGTRGSAVTLGRRRRALRRGAHAARPHAPRSSGAAAAVLARGRVEDARSDHGAQSRLPQRLAPEAPSSVVWACEAAGEAAGEAGHRARPGHWHWALARAGVCQTHVSICIDFPDWPTLGRPSL